MDSSDKTIEDKLSDALNVLQHIVDEKNKLENEKAEQINLLQHQKSSLEEENSQLKQMICGMTAVNQWLKEHYEEEKTKSAEVKKLESDNKQLVEENQKLLSVSVLRNDIEYIESKLDHELSFPEKSVMINELKNVTGFTAKLNPTIHYTKFFYFVTKSQSYLASSMSTILLRHGMSLHDFCRLIESLYQKTSYRYHNLPKSLDSTKLKDGLKLYGLDQTELLEGVDVILELKSLSIKKGNPHSMAQSAAPITATSTVVKPVYQGTSPTVFGSGGNQVQSVIQSVPPVSVTTSTCQGMNTLLFTPSVSGYSQYFSHQGSNLPQFPVRNWSQQAGSTQFSIPPPFSYPPPRRSYNPYVGMPGVNHPTVSQAINSTTYTQSSTLPTISPSTLDGGPLRRGKSPRSRYSAPY